MPPLKPISRKNFIKRFKSIGFTGPIPGTNHQFMQLGQRLIPIPNPHQGNEDIGVPLLSRILREAAISVEQWNAAASKKMKKEVAATKPSSQKKSAKPRKPRG